MMKNYFTRANLLIAPSHLICQWEAEIKKHFKNNACKFHVITVKRQFQKCHYEDFLKSDLILVSMQFFKNNYYKEYSKKGNSLWNLCMKSDLTEIYGPILYHFKWHRLILDDEFTFNKIQEIQSKYRWYLSGTPFPSRRALALAGN